MRQRPKPAKSKAKVPVAPKSPKNEDARVRDLEKRLAEALEQQTGTREILRVLRSDASEVKGEGPCRPQVAQERRRSGPRSREASGGGAGAADGNQRDPAGH